MLAINQGIVRDQTPYIPDSLRLYSPDSSKLMSTHSQLATNQARLDELKDSLQDRKNSIDQISQQLDSIGDDYLQIYENIDNTRLRIKQGDFGEKGDIEGWLSHIKALRVGRHQALYIPSIAEGLNLDGLTFGALKNDIFFKVSKARINNSTGLYSNQSLDAFDKELRAIRFGKGAEQGQHLHIVLLEQGDANKTNPKGLISAISAQQQVAKSIDLLLVAGKSTVEYGSAMQNLGDHFKSIQNNHGNYFIRSDLKVGLMKQLNMTCSYQEIGNNFNTSLSPFVFAGRKTLKLHAEGQISDHFRFKMGYSIDKGDLGAETSMSGFNLQASYTSRRMPSVHLSYIPFRQSIDIIGDQHVARNDFSTLSITTSKYMPFGNKNSLLLQATYLDLKYGLANDSETQNLRNLLVQTQMNIYDSKLRLNAGAGYAEVENQGLNSLWNLEIAIRLSSSITLSGSWSKTFSALQNSSRTNASARMNLRFGRLNAQTSFGKGDFLNHPYLGTTHEWYLQAGIGYRF